MKKLYFFLAILILAFVTKAYSQYSESFFSSNPNYKQELEKSGAKSYTIPATVNYKPLGVINWSEGFEDVTFPPPGWAVHQLDGGSNTWIRYTSSPIFGSASAAVRWESSTLPNDDWLVTPQFTVNAGAFLNFYAKRQSTSFNDSVEIYYSTSGGVPPSGYNYMTTIMPTGTTGELFQISLSSLAGQNVYIAFRYKELNQFRFYLDSVYVETPVALDAGVVAINSPKEILTTLGTTPQIVVKNLGANPTGTFNAHITITPGTYNEVASVPSLNSGESDTIDFPNWVPETAGTYTVTAWTDLSGDMNTQNDTLVKVVVVTEELYRDFVLNVSNLYPGALSFYGVEFGNNYFYVSKWNENKIFRIDPAGTTIDSFTISGLTGGLRDLAWDGEFLYGSPSSTTVYKIDVNTFTATTAFTSPISVRGIAYDAANDAFWVSNWNTDLRLVNRSGTTLETIPAASHGLTGMTGLAYDTLTPNGPYLWVLNGGSANDNKILYKFFASTGAKVDSFLITHHLPKSAIGGGVFVADNVIPGSITLGVLNQGTPHLITGYKIGSAALQPSLTLIHPNGGESFVTNREEIFVWKSQNLSGNVNLLASTDNGLSWVTISSNIPNTGFVSVTTPPEPVSNLLFKVESVDNPTIFDISDGYINIVEGAHPHEEFPVVVSDGFFAQSLKMGLDSTASDGIDTHLGEYELPPVPPTSVFDARLIGNDIGIPQLGQGVLKDFRLGMPDFSGQKIHEVKYQRGPLARALNNGITLYWSLPDNVIGRLQDVATGGNVIDVQMVGNGSYSITNPDLYDKLKITYTYTYTPPVTEFIKVLSPNGGEVYKKGENVIVAWNSNIEGNVNIYASTDGGTNWFPVQLDVPNDGVWGSSIDYDSPEGTNWKIKVESVNNPSIFDVSDNVFTIQGNKDAYLVNPFLISDGESSVELKYGLDPNATDGIDTALGEAELPPPPPTGVFDGRFVGTDIGIPQLGQGVFNDFRQGSATFSGTKVHEIQYQMGSSGDSLRVFWYLPSNVTGLLQDFVGGGIVNVSMSGEGKFTVPNPSILNKLKITLTYTPVPATVTVIAPNGGENLVVGSTYNIQWDATGINNVKLEYTTNNGTNWIEIATVPALSKAKDIYGHPKKRIKNTENLLGSYSWVVPNTPSNQCKVKISDATNPNIYDESDNVFTITEGIIGESWTVQNSNTTATLYSVSVVNDNVAWATGTGGVVIRTTNGGQTWTPVTSPRNVDAYVIKGIDGNRALVATNDSTNAKIHLTTNGGQTWTDVFTQAGGFINVIVMFDDNNGFAEGDPVGGNWTLLKTTDGGATWSPAGTLAQSGQEYGWNNSGWNVGNTIWFGTNNSRVYKSTDGGNTWTFAPTTVANSYAVTFGSAQKGFVGSAAGTANRSVDGGNSWTAISTPTTNNILGASGLNENEYWFTAGSNVYYSSDHGSNWSTSFTGSNALYHINVKGLGGSNAVGYAVGANGYLVKYFRGPITPQITVVSPNGGENWTVGSVRQIVWNAQAVSTVKLEFSTNNGATWNIIGTAPAKSNLRVNKNSEQLEFIIEGEMGVYNWTIPNTPSNQCLVKVSDNSNPAVYDVSDNVFTISTGVPGPVLQFNYDISALYPGLNSAYGSEFDGEYFYLTIWNRPKMFRINKEGTSIDSFDISGLPANTGIRDLAFDGMYLYGSNNTTTVYRIDRTTFAATPAFTSPISVRGISYDAEHDAFWVANWSTDIILVSRTGVTLYTIPASAHGFTGMSGNAYDTLSPGGPYLWIFNGGMQTDPKVLYKINPQTGARLDSIDVTPILPDGAIGGGLWVTDQFMPQTVTLGGSSQATPYRLFGYQIHVQGPIPGTVTVLSPNGGEVFYKGQIQLITWKSYEFDSKVKIRISSDGGNTFFTEISNINNTGVYAVLVPNDAQSGQDYKIRIEAQTDSTKFDESDGTFTIADAPYTLPLVDLPMVVSDQVNSRLLRFGLDTAATDGIDPQFGEEELPPVPPVGVLDARFVGDDISLPQLGQGLLYDYRRGRANSYSVKLHELKFQPGSGNDIVINLYLPEDVTARFESFVPGFDTTVSGVVRVVVSDSLVNKLKVTINYFPNSVLGSFDLFGPINNALITARQGDSTKVTFRWYNARNAVQYRLRLGIPTIPPFMLDVLSNNSGSDSLYTTTQAALYEHFVGLGFPTKDSIYTGQWAVWAYDINGDSIRSNSVRAIRIRLVPFVGVDNEAQIPDKFVVYQNYPNPFNPATKIKYGIPTDAEVTIEIYNIVGEKITTLYEGQRKAGYHETTFDASSLQSGVYFYKVIAGNTSSVKKMLLMK